MPPKTQRLSRTSGAAMGRKHAERDAAAAAASSAAASSSSQPPPALPRRLRSSEMTLHTKKAAATLIAESHSGEGKFEGKVFKVKAGALNQARAKQQEKEKNPPTPKRRPQPKPKDEDWKQHARDILEAKLDKIAQSRTARTLAMATLTSKAPPAKPKKKEVEPPQAPQKQVERPKPKGYAVKAAARPPTPSKSAPLQACEEKLQACEEKVGKQMRWPLPLQKNMPRRTSTTKATIGSPSAEPPSSSTEERRAPWPPSSPSLRPSPFKHKAPQRSSSVDSLPPLSTEGRSRMLATQRATEGRRGTKRQRSAPPPGPPSRRTQRAARQHRDEQQSAARTERVTGRQQRKQLKTPPRRTVTAAEGEARAATPPLPEEPRAHLGQLSGLTVSDLRALEESAQVEANAARAARLRLSAGDGLTSAMQAALQTQSAMEERLAATADAAVRVGPLVLEPRPAAVCRRKETTAQRRLRKQKTKQQRRLQGIASRARVRLLPAMPRE